MTGIVDGLTDGESRRLYAALWPTRTEHAIERLAYRLWAYRGRGGVYACRAGDVVDRLRMVSQRRRADRGRHDIGMRRRRRDY